LKKKIFLLLAGSIFSAVMLTGCNNNDNQNPPAPAVKNPADNNLNNNDNLNNNNLRNDLNDNNRNNNLNDNYRNSILNDNNRNNNLNDNNNYPPSEDKNTDTDKDPIKDSNTKQEEMIEDDIDVNDKDHKDE
jgi:outer membrane murein-binding lipoprotein Lpp